jgi:hypothetical protein
LPISGSRAWRSKNETVRNVRTNHLQIDETEQIRLREGEERPTEKRGTLGVGDAWTWVAIDADAELPSAMD